MTPTDANPDYLPRDPDPSVLCHRDLVERVEKARKLARTPAERDAVFAKADELHEKAAWFRSEANSLRLDTRYQTLTAKERTALLDKASRLEEEARHAEVAADNLLRQLPEVYYGVEGEQ